MGLFSFSKKSSKEHKLEPMVPKLPDFPDPKGNSNGSAGNFPSYAPSFPAPSLDSGASFRKKEPSLSSMSSSSQVNGSEKPLFVRIEHYKDAMKTIARVKDELSRTDEVLEKLNDIREAEAKELNAWHDEVRRLKDRLLEIDKKLFESET
ncbi:hypothetical protein CL617_04545 [archaeon]|nr:hypothetical protein [archaeon]|tara:strand:+ start:12826 stop:13275 length:450 start_codon:yes stop_codon:yes gene_type:complete